jgi:hypothetical protein
VEKFHQLLNGGTSTKSLQKPKSVKNTSFPLDILNGGKIPPTTKRWKIHPISPPIQKPESAQNTSFPLDILNGGKIPPTTKRGKIHPISPPIQKSSKTGIGAKYVIST